MRHQVCFRLASQVTVYHLFHIFLATRCEPMVFSVAINFLSRRGAWACASGYTCGSFGNGGGRVLEVRSMISSGPFGGAHARGGGGGFRTLQRALG